MKAQIAALRKHAASACARIDALPARERWALMAVAVALVAALELLWIWPMQQRRVQVSGAAQAAMQEQADSAAAAAQASARELAELQAALRAVERDLSRRGVGAVGGEPLGAVFQRLLAAHEVRVQGLRELGYEDIAASPAEAAASAPAAALVRHRFELVLAGPPAVLVHAVRTLDAGARPLRIERVRLTGTDGEAGETVTASITFSVVGTERSWLTL
jgi:hypothetical protein